jgi:uncharacterized protein YjlB
VNVIAHLLAPGAAIPNHPTWPLLIYPSAVKSATPEAFEELFTRNQWPAAWRDGVHPFHHFHSNGHEALGVYSGEVTVQFGGNAGVTVTAKPGDVIVLPAGTGHKKLSSKGSLGVVGAYPAGQHPDTCLPGKTCRCRRAIRFTARADRSSATGASEDRRHRNGVLPPAARGDG